jgi:hypothetical protein
MFFATEKYDQWLRRLLDVVILKQDRPLSLHTILINKLDPHFPGRFHVCIVTLSSKKKKKPTLLGKESRSSILVVLACRS